MEQKVERHEVSFWEMFFKIFFTGLILFPLYEGTTASLILLFLAAPTIVFVLGKVYEKVFRRNTH